MNWMDGPEPDEKWAAYDPPTFNQASLTPSKIVVLANLDVLRHQAFSEPLPFGDGRTIYDQFRKYVRQVNLLLDCGDNSGGGGMINLRRWQNTWSFERRDCKSLTPTRFHGYAGPLFLMMHEARHNEPGEPGHTTCFGFSNMDSSFDRGSGHARAVLYGMWVYKYGLYDPPVMRQEARTFAYATLSRLCSKPTSSNPKIQAIIDELLDEEPAGTTAASSLLPAPALLSPEDGAIFKEANNSSRETTLRWSPLPSAAAYVVQWDYCWGSGQNQHCSSDSGNSGLRERQPQIKGWWGEYRNFQLGEQFTTATSYTFNFVGTQPGRWRVWAVDAGNIPGTKSAWRQFRYALLAELDFELWIGDPAEIKAKRVRKPKTDREDARLLLRLMREDRFPRIWVPSPENRDLRQLLWHRHRMVQMRTRIMNQLQALAMNEGKRWKSKLWSQPGRTEFEKLVLGPWASRRRSELLELLDRLNPSIEELTTAAEHEVHKRPEALRLTTHPGVGPITALAFVLIIGTPERFDRGKQIGKYMGMIPTEDSSADKQRLGHITKQGSSLLRYLLVEAAQAAARTNQHWRRRYIHLAMRRHKSIAKVAMGRRMGIRLYWMWRNSCEYSPSFEFGSYVGQLGNGHGGK